MNNERIAENSNQVITDFGNKVKNFSEQFNTCAKKDEISKKIIIRGNQEGIKDNGVTLAVRTNTYSDTIETPVCGFKNSQQTSTYNDRDSVSFFTDNRSRSATLIVESGIAYGDNYVQLPLTVDLSSVKILENMVIDTMHNTRYSSLIDYCDYENKKIYVKEGWYSQGVKGLPDNSKGVKVNNTTKVWAINSNIGLRGDNDCYQGVVCEYGVYNDRIDGVAGGVDVVSLGQYQLEFGYQVRRGATGQDMKVGFMSRDARCGFRNKSDNGNETLIQSTSRDNKFDTNRDFKILNDGTLNKLKLLTLVYADEYQLVDDIGIAILVPSSKDKIYNLPLVDNRYGCQITVINVSNFDTTISSTKNIISANKTDTSLKLKPYESVILTSDKTNYYVLSSSDVYPTNIVKNGERWDLGTASERFGSGYFYDCVYLRVFNHEELSTGLRKGAMAYHNGRNMPIWFNGTNWHFADGTSVNA